MASRSGLVLLPDSSGLRDRVKAALLGSDVELWHADQLAAATYVLVDLTSAVSRGLALVLTLRRNPPPPNVRVVVMTGSQPIPEAVKRAPFVVGAIRRPGHPSEAAALAGALFASPDILHA